MTRGWGAGILKATKWPRMLRGLPGAYTCSLFPAQRVSGTGPAAAPRELSVSPEARGQDEAAGLSVAVEMGSRRLQQPLMAGEGTGSFHPSVRPGNGGRVLVPRAGLGGLAAGCVLPGPPFSLARCSWKASFPPQISCLGFRRPGPGAGGAQE